MTSKRTFQLSVRDVPTAFDYSAEQNILVVTSSSDISFYKLEDLGSPSHIIYYEQPVKCKSVKVQHGGQGLVSCISDSLVSIWDPSRSVKPMIDFVHPSKGLQDIQWSPHYSETVATSSSAGNLTMWDIRTAMRPTHDLMVSKACGKIAWCPSNPNLISSTCEDRYLLVWDIRMMPPTSNSTAPLGDVEDQQVHVIESEEGIVNYAWSPIGTAVYMTTGNCGLDVWSLAPCEDDLFDSSRISASRSSLINSQTKVLPGPYGQRLALLHCRPRTGESTVYLRKFQDVILAGSVASTESTYAPSIDSPGQEGEKTQQADPFVKVGSSKSRILDMKWLNSASDSNTGDSTDLDLLLLNEDALLQVLHVPSDASKTGANPARTLTPMSYFNKRTYAYTGSPRLGNSSTDLPYQEHKALRLMKQSIGAADRMDSMYSDKNGGTSSRDGNSSGNLLRDRNEFERSLSGPAKRYSLGQKSQSNAALNTNPQLQMVGPVTFQNLLEDDLIALEYGINHGYLEGWRIGRIDPFTRRIFLELLIPNIDSYSIANKHNNASFNTFYRSEDLNSFYNQKRTANVRFVELAVTFPVKYCSFWSPTFAIENKSGLAFNPTSLSGLIIELTAICRTFAEKTASSTTALPARSGDASLASSRRSGSDSFAPHMNDCLLFQLARSFRKRLFRLWEKIIESDRITISSTTVMQQQTGGSGGESNILSTSLQSDHAIEVDEDAPYMKYIEPLAFRVPAPVCSAGIFNGRGELICFGNAKVCLTEAACHSSLDSVIPVTPSSHTTTISHPHSTGKHKSFANLLVSKIITTSAEADNSTSAANASTSAEDVNTTNKPTGGSKNNMVTFESPGQGKTAKKQFEPIERATLPGNKPQHPRTSSESEVSEENNTPLHEDDDEEYQFTFDHETKVPAPAKDIVRRTSITGVQRAPSGEEKRHAPLALGGECSPAEELTRGHSERSLLFAEDSSAVAVDSKSASSSKILLQLYRVMYGVERRLLYSYSVGPLSRRRESTTSTPITPVAQAVASQVAANTLAAKDIKTAKTKARSAASQVSTLVPPSRTSCAVPALTQEEALDRAAACRRNARAVFEISPEDKGLCQFWNLLAVVLDMLTITDSGCLIGWNHCTIGLALLHRLYKYLCENADLQTFATAICILGGSDILVDLLVPYYSSGSSSDQQASGEEKQRSKISSPEAPSKATRERDQFEPIRTKKHLEMILYSYNDVLNRWGEQLSAVEVSKHINFDYFGPNPRALLHDAKGCEISVKVCCYYCEKEIEPKRLSGDVTSPSSGGASTTTTSSSRPNSRTGAQVTFHPGTGGGTGAASGSGTASGLAPGSNTLLWCGDCKDWAQRCVVCELAVRGSVSVCAKCGHGGHFAHMQTWFQKSAVCASGCGCRCIAEGEENVNQDDSSDSDKDAEEFVEDGENVRDIYDIFGTNPPNYLEEIYNRTSDYNYNNFFEKWADSPAGEVYFEYS